MRVDLGLLVNREHSYLFKNRTPFVQPLNTHVVVMLSSASTTVNKQVSGVSPTGWYGNFSDTVVLRVICWTPSRCYLPSAMCLSPSVPAPRISQRTCVIPRRRYSFTEEINNFHLLLNTSCNPTLLICELSRKYELCTNASQTLLSVNALCLIKNVL